MSRVLANAALSACGKHRFWLTRRWGLDRPDRTLVFVMLNPSTADAQTDDPTIRRCKAFAAREGYTRLDVVNLFTYRTPSPAELWALPEAERNHSSADGHLVDTALIMPTLVCAWGAVPKHAHTRVGQVARVLSAVSTLVCLGTTKNGMPRHPLYVRSDQPLEPWSLPQAFKS